jgi:hypothetical protein
MSDLVSKLSQGTHAVELKLRPENTRQALKECLERGYVHVKFINTRGGTELGFKLDEGMAQAALTDVDGGQGLIHVSGNLSLDYERVRCVAEINPDTFEGTGRLELLQ